jgi:predicted lipid-binding transport protein (Tim44 family)
MNHNRKAAGKIMSKKNLIWIGGIVGVLTMGGLRFIGKNFGFTALLVGMTLVALGLAWMVIKYVFPKWE